MTDALFETPGGASALAGNPASAPAGPTPGAAALHPEPTAAPGLDVGVVAGTATTPALVIDVLGTPISQGSKRHVGNGVMVESSKLLKPWRQAVVAAAIDVTGGGTAFERGVPVWMGVTFFFRRPNSHFRTGANSHLLRDRAPRYPVGRPDRDKILRAVTDALTDAGIWWDDSQVVGGPTWKAWADYRQPGALIELGVAR